MPTFVCQFAILLAAVCSSCTAERGGFTHMRAGDDASTRVPPRDVRCRAVRNETSLHIPSLPDAQRIAGTYALTVVADENAEKHEVRGKMELWPTDSGHRHPEILSGSEFGRPVNTAVTYLLQGASDVELDQLGPVSLLYSPSSRDPRKPGVLMLYKDAQLTLWFGTPLDFLTVDSGVVFSVTALDDAGFRGTWSDGGILADSPFGHFCAIRISPRTSGDPAVLPVEGAR